jgi:hypothetical protein
MCLARAWANLTPVNARRPEEDSVGKDAGNGRFDMRRMTIGTAMLCAMALMAPAAAQAAVRYAAPSGGLTTGPCTTVETACEVNRAVETVAASGDEVILSAGVYEIGADQLFVPPNVNVHGDGAARHTEVVSTGTGATVALNNDGGRIADVTVTHNSGQFGAVSLSSQSLVERVIARSSLAGVQACQLWKGTIRNTVCWASGANATAAGTSLAGPSGTHTPQLRNVTAIGTGTGSSGVSFNAAGTGVAIAANLRNVIADGPAGDIRAFTSNGGTATSVDASTSMFIQAVTNPGGGATAGTITANNAQGNVPTSASFISPNTGDFHQKPISLSIDRGSDDGSLGSNDVDGQGRKSGEEIDIGADEFIENHVRYAEPNGNGPEPCFEADPCGLKSAVEGNASDGDEVILVEGTYELGATNATADDAVDVHPAPGAEVNVTATGNYALILQDAGARLSDVEIDTTDGTALYLNGGVAERIDAHASGAGDNACGGAAGTLRDSVCFSDAAFNGAGIGLNLSASGDRSLKLRNVTAVGIGATSDGMRFSYDGGNVAVDARNVIASGTDIDVRASSNVSVDLDHSNYSTVSTSGTGTVTDAGTLSNQMDEPAFVDAAAGDLHQLADSPTVDKGAAASEMGSADIDGESRSQGAAPDIGADELTVVAPPEQGAGGSTDQGSAGKATKKCKKRGKSSKRKRCKRKPKKR